ncbi:MAG: YbjN domain-containing protein [Actinomycetota bacterium]
MTHLEILQPFVERTVGQYLGTTEVTVWKDGTIPIRSGSTIVNVRLLDGEDGSRPVLQVYCPMLSEIDASPELLTKLHEANADLTFVRAFWVDRQVILAMELLAESLDRDQVAHAVSLVSLAGNFWDSELNSTFGGRLSAAGGLASLLLILRRRDPAARLAAAMAVGWVIAA